jgi:hypothetical protein
MKVIARCYGLYVGKLLVQILRGRPGGLMQLSPAALGEHRVAKPGDEARYGVR